MADSWLLDSGSVDGPLLAELEAKVSSRADDTIWVSSPEAQPQGTWQEISGDTVWVPARKSSAVASWEGIPIDTAFWAPLESQYPNLRFANRKSAWLFACVRISIAPDYEGFVVRVPGMYTSSRLDMWIYSQRAMRFLAPVALAEAWGDAGESLMEESWVMDVDGDGSRDVVRHRRHTLVDIESPDMPLLAEQDSVVILKWSGRAYGLPTRAAGPLASWAGGSQPPGRP